MIDRLLEVDTLLEVIDTPSEMIVTLLDMMATLSELRREAIHDVVTGS